MRSTSRSIAVAAASAVLCLSAWAQAGTEPGRPAAVVPLESEPPPRLVVYPPLPAPLARGVAIVQYRTENMRILPVFGKGALEASPHLGHLHVTLDGRPGTWAHTSGDPIIVVGLPPGPHKMLIELAEPDHQIVAGETVAFVVPDQASPESHAH
jgi:hypothetical protein